MEKDKFIKVYKEIISEGKSKEVKKEPKEITKDQIDKIIKLDKDEKTGSRVINSGLVKFNKKNNSIDITTHAGSTNKAYLKDLLAKVGITNVKNIDRVPCGNTHDYTINLKEV